MFPFSVLLITCATQGASSSGLLLNARVCPIGVTLSLSLHLSPNTLTRWWPPLSLHQLLTCPSSAVCRSERGRLGYATWQRSLCDLVFAWHLLHSKRFTDMLRGGLEARSCVPFRFEGMCDCVCAFWILLSNIFLLSDFFSWVWFWFLVSTTGMSTLTSSPHSFHLALSGNCQ